MLTKINFLNQNNSMSDMNMGYSPMTKAVYREAAVFTFLDSSFPFSMGAEREELWGWR